MFKNRTGPIKILLPSFPNISSIFRSLYLIFGYLEVGRRIEIVGIPRFADPTPHSGSLATSDFAYSMFNDLFIETVVGNGCEFHDQEIDVKKLSFVKRFGFIFDSSIIFNVDTDILIIRASGSSLLEYFISQIKKKSSTSWKIRFCVLFFRGLLIQRPFSRGRLYCSDFDNPMVDTLRKDIESFFQGDSDPITAIALNLDLKGEVEPKGRRCFGPRLIRDIHSVKKDQEIFRLVNRCSEINKIILLSKKSFDVDLIAPRAKRFDLRKPEEFGVTHAQAVCLIQEICREFVSWPSTYCSFIASSDAVVSEVFYDGKDGF